MDKKKQIYYKLKGKIETQKIVEIKHETYYHVFIGSEDLVTILSLNYDPCDLEWSWVYHGGSYHNNEEAMLIVTAKHNQQTVFKKTFLDSQIERFTQEIENYVKSIFNFEHFSMNVYLYDNHENNKTDKVFTVIVKGDINIQRNRFVV